MTYILMTLLAAGIVVADQLSKAWVVNHIGPYMCADAGLCAGHLQSLAEVYGIGIQEMILQMSDGCWAPGIGLVEFLAQPRSPPLTVTHGPKSPPQL